MGIWVASIWRLSWITPLLMYSFMLCLCYMHLSLKWTSSKCSCWVIRQSCSALVDSTNNIILLEVLMAEAILLLKHRRSCSVFLYYIGKRKLASGIMALPSSNYLNHLRHIFRNDSFILPFLANRITTTASLFHYWNHKYQCNEEVENAFVSWGK